MPNTTQRTQDGTEHEPCPPSARCAPVPAPSAGRADRGQQSESEVLVFSRYADVAVIARDPAFEAKDAAWFNAHLPGWRRSPGMRLFGTSMVFHNGASHQRLRKAASPAFSPARLRSLRETVHAATEECMDLLDARPHGDVVDLHALLTLPVTCRTQCALIGLPEQDAPFLHELVQPLLALLDPVVGPRALREADRAAETLRPYLDRLVVERRARPGGDLASSVACLLGDDEAASALALALTAGFDTTVTLLDHAITALMTSPVRAAVAAGEPSHVDAAISESLRLAPSVRLITRVARHEVTVGGVRVPAGREVMALIAEAHRDPEHFTDPDVFDPNRPASRLLSFGGGAHYCLGAQLARLEASLVLPALLRRFPRMAPAGPPCPDDRVTVSGWTDLPVVLDP